MPNACSQSPPFLTLAQVTEEMLATSFSECGTVVDCRICGDPNSAMRFAFIEFGSPAEAQKVGRHLECCRAAVFVSGVGGSCAD